MSTGPTPVPLRALVVVAIIALAVLLLASAGLASSGLGPDDVGDGGEPATTTYTVVAGDTLWSIAGRNVGDGGDVRGGIDAIRRLNDLDGSVIHPGQVLVVPTDGG